MDLHETVREESASCSYGATLQNDSSCSLPCTWAASDPSLFLVRGENYLQDHQKVFLKKFNLSVFCIQHVKGISKNYKICFNCFTH